SVTSSGAARMAMPRDPRILALYQKALQDRSPLVPPSAGLSPGDMILACTAITLATVIFFWGYDAVVHREPIFPPSFQQATYTRTLAAHEAPVPDMQSPEIIRANSDVLTKQPEAAKSLKQTEAPSRKKHAEL